MTTTLPDRPLEVTLISSYGPRTVRLSSVRDVDRNLQEQYLARNIARHPGGWKTRELRLALLMVACDALLDARLELAEREMTAVVDAWAPMPDFRRLVQSVKAVSSA